MSEPEPRRPTTGHPARRARSRSSSPPPPPPRGGIRGRVVLWIVVVLMCAGAAVLLRQFTGESATPLLSDIPEDGAPVVSDEPPVGDRAVILVFPEWDAMGTVTEARRIPSEGRPEEDLLNLMHELCAGPQVTGAVRAVPREVRPLSVFLDAENQSCVIDFSVDLVTRHPGGSAGENATIEAIVRTVALNFPDLRSCRILVGGAPTETLAGHIGLSESFALERWR